MKQTLREGFGRISERMFSASDKRGPWLVEGCVIATDGHLLCAVPAAMLPEFVSPAPDKIRDTVRGWLGLTQTDPLILPIASLRAFAEVGVDVPPCAHCQDTGRLTCPECNGSRTHTCECEACGDEHEATCNCTSGTVNCRSCNDREDRPGTFLSRTVNTVLLKDILTLVATDGRDIAASVECLHATRREDYDYGYVFRPVGDGVPWLAVLMLLARHVKAVCAYQVEAVV